MMPDADRRLLSALFEAAVARADPKREMAAVLPPPPKGRTVVVGAGKGAAQMAQALEALWDGPLEGLVVTRYGFAAPCRDIEVVEAGHPLPDAAGFDVAQRLMALVSQLGPDDLVIGLICGGGSALLPMPAQGLTLQDEIDLNSALLASGAPISVMNAIRKQVSRIKGGRLALAAAPARVVTLVVSDVPGDDPAQVASGPTIADAASREDARRLIENWNIRLTPSLRDWLWRDDNLPPRPDDPAFEGHSVHLLASARASLEAAASRARRDGVAAVILSDRIEGESREIARMHGALAAESARFAAPFAPPVVLLSGGETTVSLTSPGRGGRNSEFALSLALAAEGSRFAALAADTDGIDGTEDNAGAFVDGGSTARLRALGEDPLALLRSHRSWDAFERLGDLFTPGPTGTNVNDFRAILLR